MFRNPDNTYYDIDDNNCGDFSYQVGNPDVAVFTVYLPSNDLSGAPQAEIITDGFGDVTKVSSLAPYETGYTFSISVTLV